MPTNLRSIFVVEIYGVYSPFAYTAVVFIYHTLLKLKNNNFYFHMRNNLISNPASATVDSFSSSKNGRFKIKEDKELGMPTLQFYAGVSSFETMSPALKFRQSWRLKTWTLKALHFEIYI